MGRRSSRLSSKSCKGSNGVRSTVEDVEDEDREVDFEIDVSDDGADAGVGDAKGRDDILKIKNEGREEKEKNAEKNSLAEYLDEGWIVDNTKEKAEEEERKRKRKKKRGKDREKRRRKMPK